jgi:hypothetical protein
MVGAPRHATVGKYLYFAAVERPTLSDRVQMRAIRRTFRMGPDGALHEVGLDEL